jgi:hypothetical protein
MPRALAIRATAHAVVALTFLALGAWCLLPSGSGLANSIPYIAFVSNFAIVYTAVSSLEAIHAARKADPEDPA